MNFRKFRNVCALGLAGAMVMGSFTVSAVSPRDLFDADYYAEQYQDVVATVGDDEAALYNHYVKHGMKEGRSLSPVFDVKSYRERYSDLEAAFGDDWSAYMNHMIEYGLYEDRYTVDKNVYSLTAEQALTIYAAKINARIEKEGVEAVLGDFDTEAYKEANPDVAAALGNNTKKLIEHYLEHGIKEGRASTTDKSKDPVVAIKKNPDVVAAVADFSPEAIVEKAEEIKKAAEKSEETSEHKPSNWGGANCSHAYLKDRGNCEAWIYKCGFCGDEYTVNGTHQWSDTKVSFTEDLATCTEAGLRYYACNNCNATKDSEVAPSIHDVLKNGMIENGATSTTCGTCGNTVTVE